jgi:RHS repeat-associated protein
MNANYPNAWDVENRLITTQANTLQPTTYSYDPWGRRVWKELAGVGLDGNGNPNPATFEIYFYGATGQKLETYSGAYTGVPGYCTLEGINIYFGGKLLQSKGVWVATDRLGSVRANSNGEAMSYWPYGEERTTTTNGREKFATYTRDATGQDYAAQRYYNSSMGAFWSPDPGGIRTANSSDPTSWNRYSYVSGDPANHSDHTGMELDLCGPDWQNDPSLQGPCCNPSNQLLGAPLDPACYVAGGTAGTDTTSSSPSSAPPPVIYVVAKMDCYKLNMASAKGKQVWERDIDYSAYLLNPDGSFTKLTGNGSSVITEQLTQTAGQTGKPGPASSSPPGGVFEDTLSAGTTGPFQVTQTFTVTYQGGTYNAQIQSFTGQVTPSNIIDVQLGSISVNNNTNIGKDGKRPPCN